VPIVTTSLDKDKQATLTVYGNLTIQNAAHLTDAFDKLLNQDVTLFLVDLSKVAYLDSTGLSCLVRMRQRLAEIDGAVRVTGVLPSAMEIFQATRLDQVLDLEEAPGEEGQGG